MNALRRLPAFARVATPGVLLLLVVAGCQAFGGLPATVGLPASPLIVVVATGGRCVDGVCSQRATVDATGRMIMFDGSEATIPPVTMARIAESIVTTDWDTVLAEPFEGDCPTAYDGMELVWTIRAPGRAVVVADCTIAVDYDAEPFRSLRGEIFALGG